MSMTVQQATRGRAIMGPAWPWIILVLLLVLLPSLGAAQDRKDLHPVTLQLPWVHQFQFAGYYAALEQGYYEEAGLAVTIREGQPGLRTVEEVLSGRAHYGVGRSELLLHRLQGAPVVVLAPIFQHSAGVLLARKDAGIRTPQDLVGRRVMLMPGYNDAEHKATLLSEGVDLASLKIIPTTFDLDDLLTGKTDAINAYISNEPFYLREQGVEPALIMPRTYGIDFYGDSLFTSEAQIAQNPTQVKAFREASLKGWIYAMAHKGEIIALLRNTYGVQKSPAHLRFEADIMDDLIKAELVEVGHMNPGRWQHMADAYVRLGMAAPGYSLDGFLYDPEPTFDTGKLMALAYLGLAFFAVASVALLLRFNRQLNRILVEKTTALEEAKTALVKKEKLYRFLFDNAPTGIALVGEDGVISEINNQALKVTGYDRQDAKRMNVMDTYCNPDDRKRMVRLVGEQGIVKGLEVKLKRRDGTILDVRLTSAAVLVDERPHILSLLEDITMIKEAEQEKARLDVAFQRMQKMEAIGLMAGGVAHDLNNILSGVVGYPELLLMQLPEDSPWRSSVMEIQKSGQRAAAVVEDLLTVARGVASVKTPHDINKLIDEYLESPECRHLKMLYRDVDCSVQLASDLAPVICSPVHIKKCLMNLVINGAEAVLGKGNVMISTRNEVVTEQSADRQGPGPGRYVVLSVADTGHGISPQDREHVFEPFYTKKVMGRSGTGLGLAVVWNTMQDHNGVIGLQSSDKGTVFELYFPASTMESVLAHEEASIEEIEGQGQTILIVDDEPLQRDIAGRMLASMGYKVEAVCSGEEAVDYMTSHSADLLLLDMIMAPGMNGRRTYEEIIKTHPGQKAVICSGFSQNDEARMAHVLGAGGFLKKPYTRSQLGRAVQQELHR